MECNRFYKRDIFVLVEVSFTRHKTALYTYAAHVKQNVKIGDWVLVPTGVPENIFTENGVAYDHGQVARVKAIRPSKDIMKENFLIRPVVGVIDHSMYDKISAARHKK